MWAQTCTPGKSDDSRVEARAPSPQTNVINIDDDVVSVEGSEENDDSEDDRESVYSDVSDRLVNVGNVEVCMNVESVSGEGATRAVNAGNMDKGKKGTGNEIGVGNVDNVIANNSVSVDVDNSVSVNVAENVEIVARAPAAQDIVIMDLEDEDYFEYDGNVDGDNIPASPKTIRDINASCTGKSVGYATSPRIIIKELNVEQEQERSMSAASFVGR